MDAICKRRGSGSLGAASWLQFHANPRELGFKSASKKATISATIDHDFRHNRALIGVDRAPDPR